MNTKHDENQMPYSNNAAAADPRSSESKDIRLRLEMELKKRMQSNPRYSLRAFARLLDIESSRLSKILRGQRPVNHKLFDQFAEKLDMSPREADQYRRSMGFPIPQNSSVHRTYLQLSQDTFEAIEDWHHYGILELMKLNNFQPSHEFIASTFDLSTQEVEAYLERLVRLGLLEIRENGWHDRTEGFSTHILSDVHATSAHRRFQTNLLRLAIEAMHNVPMQLRDQSSMMMATHSSKILEAKKKIRKFQRELTEFLEDCKEKDSVFQLTQSLFPLTRLEDSEKRGPS